MTHRLILTRHAKSSWDHPGMRDHQRPLNKRGRASAHAVGKWLDENSFSPDQVLCSSAARTRETLDRTSVSANARFLDTLYHAGADIMLNELQKASADTVMMIGHNPGIGEFAERLLRSFPNHPGFLSYPTCATLVADFDIESWKDARFGTATHVAFIVPRDLI